MHASSGNLGPRCHKLSVSGYFGVLFPDTTRMFLDGTHCSFSLPLTGIMWWPYINGQFVWAVHTGFFFGHAPQITENLAIFW